MREWLELLLVYQLWDGLNWELYHNCLPWEVPNNLRACYQMATNMELDLM